MSRRGFTLIEMLVAIAILAVISLLSWRAIDAVVRARTQLTEELAQQRGLEAVFSQFETDLRLAARDSGAITSVGTASALPGILFGRGEIRVLRQAPAPGGGALRWQFVRYRLADDALWRETRAVATPDEARQLASVADWPDAQRQRLLAPVNFLGFQVWNTSLWVTPDGDLLRRLQLAQSLAMQLPAEMSQQGSAVRLSIELGNGERFERAAMVRE
ncbi:PulJ/GspJ family protein [Derxia lacustris]|uniref:PulJ/GspJ family protein n=1 Tax=Derxia lacustris TaxID=764842 RepID=UPI001F1FC1AC|nr:prepilin-type N-terminal cleavage/methylation domain-containing protein [Derxia lacustris]